MGFARNWLLHDNLSLDPWVRVFALTSCIETIFCSKRPGVLVPVVSSVCSFPFRYTEVIHWTCRKKPQTIPNPVTLFDNLWSDFLVNFFDNLWSDFYQFLYFLLQYDLYACSKRETWNHWAEWPYIGHPFAFSWIIHALSFPLSPKFYLVIDCNILLSIVGWHQRNGWGWYCILWYVNISLTICYFFFDASILLNLFFLFNFLQMVKFPSHWAFSRMDILLGNPLRFVRCFFNFATMG